MTTHETPTKFELTLRDGTTIAVESPPLPDFGEFCLPGNAREYGDFIAFHDAAHDVGGTYRLSTGGWTLNGPVGPADFWQACEIMNRNREALEALAGTAGDHGQCARH